MIRLNSISDAVFNSNAAEFNGVEKERAYLVTSGRLLMAEKNGKDNDALRVLRNKPAEFQSKLGGDGMSYADLNRMHKEKLMLYAAKRCCAISGETAPADYDSFVKNQRKFMGDSTFLKVLAGIVRDIITPVLPATMSNALDWLAETVPVPMGKTYELDVASNDVFLFNDDSWGASRSKPSNYLYSQPVTLNPTLRTAKATIKWYQMVGNNADLGSFYNSMAAGMYSKITAMAMNAMINASANNAFIPANLQFTNTSANWVTAATRVAAVNNSKYRTVIGVGHPSALTKALPSGVVNASSVNLDSALSTMLGIDWTRYGFLGEYMGINLMPLDDALVPGTQNTTLTGVVPTDKIWLLSINGYKPIYIGMEEGTPIELELSPSETADNTIDIMVSVSLDVAPVFASKVALITA